MMSARVDAPVNALHARHQVFVLAQRCLRKTVQFAGDLAQQPAYDGALAFCDFAQQLVLPHMSVTASPTGNRWLVHKARRQS